MDGKKRKAKEEALSMALACGATAAQAAEKAGVHKRTVYRRLADPAFQAKVEQLRSDMVQRSAAMLTAASLEGVKTLMQLLGPGNPPHVRLQAARVIVDMGMKLREQAELLPRIRALEARQGPALAA